VDHRDRGSASGGHRARDRGPVRQSAGWRAGRCQACAEHHDVHHRRAPGGDVAVGRARAAERDRADAIVRDSFKRRSRSSHVGSRRPLDAQGHGQRYPTSGRPRPGRPERKAGGFIPPLADAGGQRDRAGIFPSTGVRPQFEVVPEPARTQPSYRRVDDLPGKQAGRSERRIHRHHRRRHGAAAFRAILRLDIARQSAPASTPPDSATPGRSPRARIGWSPCRPLLAIRW
jgi:hypothetical protein